MQRSHILRHPERALRFFAMLATCSAGALGADTGAGRSSAAQCVPCHGLDGIGVQPMYPNLAGQKAEYIVRQLWAFKRGARNDPSMKMQVRRLDGQDIDNLAAYYSGLDCRAE